MYLSPTIAGIAMYNGALRKENQEGRKQSPYADPEAVALKDASGNYVRSTVWEPILTVADWTALVADWKRRREGLTFSAAGTRKYLLSGLLRCGRIHQDGAICGRSLAGTVVAARNGKRHIRYRCPPRALGGCSACISASKLDPLIEELLFAHIAANAPGSDEELSAVPDDPDAADLADVQGRLAKLRTGYAQGTVTDDSMFNIVPQLEARERKLKSELAKKAKIRRGRTSRAQSADDVRREWDAGDVGVKRAILSRYLKAIIIRKSTLANTRLVDYSAIEPIWRTDDDPMPGEYLP